MYGFESLKDLLDVLLVPAIGGAIALFWPQLQAHYKRERFVRLIKRELEEVGPELDEDGSFPKQPGRQ